MEKITIMQGDAYSIPIEILTSDGIPASNVNFKDVEITLGHITKRLSNNEVFYNPNEKIFEFPLTQKETFSLYESKYDIQVRVKVSENQVIGFEIKEIAIIKSKSKAVL